jgi:hypothetical protein
MVREVQPLLTRRRDDAGMLSPASLTALSVGAAQSGFAQAGPFYRARARPLQPASPAVPATTSPAREGDAPQPNRLLPRGSLLDLSV